MNTFANDFKSLTGIAPFPWQESLYQRFVKGEIPRVCNLPTGLGKTSILAIWLIAMKNSPAALPRRLVYVVNRRTVVDQTTDEARRLRENAPQIGISQLAISTLRGQFADNQEWSADPSSPAIICGTVDMIGSRLLFSGYGIGFKSRPLHAGFLGQDALLVHDEAHLEPAFQKLVDGIASEQDRERVHALPWPKLRIMQLSATARHRDQAAEPSFGLTSEELSPPTEIPAPPAEPLHHVWRRLKAKKRLQLHPVENSKDSLTRKIVERALAHVDSNAAVLIFARLLEDVEKISAALGSGKTGVPERHVAQLTGTMRGLERDRMVRENPVFMRFLPAKNRRAGVAAAEGTVFLVCTSAGEVGIDISADHLVCDLSTFESMAQRLGRVNRYGDGDAIIDVVHPVEFDDKDKLKDARERTLQLLRDLNGDASPRNLGQLDPQKCLAAFAPEPVILPATDILFDAWALTSIRQTMPGRQPIEPYLHGIAEWQPAETQIGWREEIAVITGELLSLYSPEDLLDDYPLKPHELLRDRSDRIFKHLEAVAQRHPSCSVWILDDRAAPVIRELGEFVAELARRKPDDRNQQLNGRTILLPPKVGGLRGGMLDSTLDNGDDVADSWLDEFGQPRRRRIRTREPVPPSDLLQDMALVRTIDTRPDADETETSDAESEREQDEEHSSSASRYWQWYVRLRDTDDVTRAALRPIPWDDHTNSVVVRTREILDALNWPSEWDELKQAVILAAQLHDLGKKREQWQRSIGNPDPADWHAKSGKPENGPRWRRQKLGPYRHEFGSVLDALDASAEHAAALTGLSDEMRDVVLHLVAAHHGRARPHFHRDEAIDPERSTSESESLAAETPRRFGRLQRRFGRWGLAYLESLLRAADRAASIADGKAIQ